MASRDMSMTIFTLKLMITVDYSEVRAQRWNIGPLAAAKRTMEAAAQAVGLEMFYY
jgi:hypothetical protein